jgi:superfamily II DNA/RNA helicase
MKNFNELDLLETLLATLIEKGFNQPTEIQMTTLPLLLKGTSIVGVAETGSGKTLAYALPLLQMVKTLEINGEAVDEDSSPRAVVVVPTRELGEQVAKVFKQFTHATRVRVRTLLGGIEFQVSRRNIQGPFEILIATPGRLVKCLEMGIIKLEDVRTLVFDEADQMLDQGFLPDVHKMMGHCKNARQLVLFSATVSPAVETLIDEYFKKAKMIRTRGSHQLVASLKTVNQKVLEGKRRPLLEALLKKKVEGGTIFFTNTREQCDALAKILNELGHELVLYRGEMDKNERRRNLKAFREGKAPFLVSTDLAARGLDIDHVGRVVNYHMPSQMETYLHRVGRTARAGRSGLVINFVTERDQKFVLSIVKLQTMKADLSNPPEFKKKSKIIPKVKIAFKKKSLA